jgi:hypothetical protein
MNTPLLRLAHLGDVPELLRIKAALPLPIPSSEPNQHTHTHTGGFLLGSSYEHYCQLVSCGSVLVLETQEPSGISSSLSGFSVTLSDAMLRAAQTVQQLQTAQLNPRGLQWLRDFAQGTRLALIDQLAVLPHARVYAGTLALLTLRRAWSQHDLIGVTTVLEPICNRASLPFLQAVGFSVAGQLAEQYDQLEITSQLHVLTPQAYQYAQQQKFLPRYSKRSEKYQNNFVF